MRVEESLQHGEVALSDFAQHPPNGLVNQVVLVTEQAGGDSEGVVKLISANHPQRRDDRDRVSRCAPTIPGPASALPEREYPGIRALTNCALLEFMTMCRAARAPFSLPNRLPSGRSVP
jgi:hypothetical protein